MNLKCFSAPRSAKQQQQPQLAEVQAIEPLLSDVPAAPAFAQCVSPGCRSATNALCPCCAKRSVPVPAVDREQRGGQPVRRQPRGAGRARCGGSGAERCGPYLPRRSWRRRGGAARAGPPGAAASAGWSARPGWPAGSCTAPSAA